MYELKSIISKIVKNFKLSLPETGDIEIYATFVLRSATGVKLVISRR
jgi:hypothetical protein